MAHQAAAVFRILEHSDHKRWICCQLKLTTMDNNFLSMISKTAVFRNLEHAEHNRRVRICCQHGDLVENPFR